MNKRSNFYKNGEIIDFRFHRILDHHQVEVAVETVVNTATKDHFAIFTKALVLKMFMFATSGDQDILKDNGTYYYE